MECLVMNYSDDEDAFPPEIEERFTLNGSNPKNPDLEENVILVPDSPSKISETLGSLTNGNDVSPCVQDMEQNTIESFQNHLEVDDNVVVVSDEDDSDSNIVNDGVSSIIISRVETVEEDQGDAVLCNSTATISTEATSLTFATFSLADDIEVTTSLDKNKNHNVSPISDKENPTEDVQKIFCSQDKRTTKKDHPLSSQTNVEKSGQSVTNSLETSLIAKTYCDRKIIPNLRIFKCKLCSYSSTIRFGLKRHLLTHSEKSNKNKLRSNPRKVKLSRNETSESEEPGKLERINSRSKQSFTCDYCSYSSNTRYRLSLHIRVHGYNQPIYKCKKCDYKSVKATVVQHMKTTHQISKYNHWKDNACEFCSYTTKFMGRLKAHLQQHTIYGKPNFSCPKCDFKSPNAALMCHLKVAHGMTPESAKMTLNYLVRCNSTALISTEAADMEVTTNLDKNKNSNVSHISDNGDSTENVQEIVIPQDKSSTKKYHVLSSQTQVEKSGHSMTKSDETSIVAKESCDREIIPNPRMFKCNLCSYSSTIRFGLKRHLLTHSEKSNPTEVVSKFKCGHCSYEGTTKQSLYHHSLRMHKDVSLNCDPSVRAHLKRTRLRTLNNNSSTFECDKCQYKTVKRKEFSNHRMQHYKNKLRSNPRKVKLSRNETSESEEPGKLERINSKSRQSFTCDYCSYSSNKQSLLSSHSRVHRYNQPIYTCDKCDYKAVKCSIWQHMKTTHQIYKTSHWKDKVCEFCSYTTKFMGRLKAHLQQHTIYGKPNFSCPKCDFKSPNVALRYHLKVAHGMTSESATMTLDYLERCNSAALISTEAAKMEVTTNLNKNKNHNVSPISDNGNSTENVQERVIPQDKSITKKGHIVPFQTHAEKSGQSVTNSHETSIIAKKPCDREIIPNPRMFKCNLCSYSSTIRFGLKRHLLTHSEKSNPTEVVSKFKCDHCSYEGMTKQSLYYHSSRMHKDASFKCDPSVRAHLKRTPLRTCKNNNNTFECDKCQFKTGERNAFLSHRIEHYKNKLRSIPRNIKLSRKESNESEEPAKLKRIDSRSKPLFTCDYCSYSSSQKRYLCVHIRSHRHNPPIYSCHKCDYKSVESNVSAHLKTTHQIKSEDIWKHKSIIESDVSTYFKNTNQIDLKDTSLSEKTCEFCSYTTNSDYRLRFHRRQHTIYAKPIFSCPKCDFKSPDFNLICHLKVAHKMTLQNAKVTVKRLVNRLDLTINNKNKKINNKLVKTSLLLLSCEFCSYTTKFPQALERHRRQHTISARPNLNCPKCDFKLPSRTLICHLKGAHEMTPENAKMIVMFLVNVNKYKSTESNLSTYLKKANNIDSKTSRGQVHKRKHKCKFCSFATTDTLLLTNHLLLHTEYNAPVCSNFQQLKQEESNKIYKCRLCSYTSRFRFNLITHDRIHKKGVAIYKCDYCDFTGFKLNVTRHSRNIHGKDPIRIHVYKCKFCSFSTNTSEDIGQHVCVNEIRKATAKLPISYKTKKVNFKSFTPNKTNVKQFNVNGSVKLKRTKSLASTYDQKKYSCQYCSYSTNTCNLKRHTLVHTLHNRPILKCNQCDYKSVFNNLVKHCRDVHGRKFEH